MSSGLNKQSFRRILRSYFAYHHESRAQLSLYRNSPAPHEIEPPERGKVIAILQVGGLRHRYRRAAWPLGAARFGRTPEVEVRTAIPDQAIFPPRRPAFLVHLPLVGDAYSSQLCNQHARSRSDNVLGNDRFRSFIFLDSAGSLPSHFDPVNTIWKTPKSAKSALPSLLRSKHLRHSALGGSPPGLLTQL